MRSEQAILDAVLHFLALQNERLESTGLLLFPEVTLLNQDSISGAQKHILHIGFLVDGDAVRGALGLKRLTGDREQVRIVIWLANIYFVFCVVRGARVECGASIFEELNVSRIDFFHFFVAKFVHEAIKLTSLERGSGLLVVAADTTGPARLDLVVLLTCFL